MLKLNNVSLQIGSKKIINNISANIQDGEFIIIVGQNGAGKSSLLELIAGTLAPTEGSVELAGQRIDSMLLAQRAQLIGRLYQQPAQGSVGSMTVRENCALVEYKYKKVGLSPALACIEESTACKQITQLFHDKIFDVPMQSLSGGQRQLITFILVAAQKRMRLFLLDEPTAALDFSATQQMLAEISKNSLQKKVITILVTHDLDIATSLGTRLWIINNGKLLHDITDGQHREMTREELKKLML